MTLIKLHSPKAKAELKSAIANDAAKNSLQLETYIKARADLKGFWSQYPKARQLFGTLIGVWRGSSARRPAVEGYWAAYPYPFWVDKSGFPERTLKRLLDLLEGYGLIERTHGHHGGTRTLTFIRPTHLALDLSDARPEDRARLGSRPSKVAKPTAPASSATAKSVPQSTEEHPTSLDELMAILHAPTEA